MTFRTVVFCLLLTVLCGAATGAQEKQKPAASQDPDPVIRNTTRLVTVTVSVADPYGRFVAGLSKRHFDVYENDVRREIEFFSADAVSVSVGIVFDVSGSMRNVLPASREALRAFVDSAIEGDEFFLAAFNNKVDLLCDFTSDGERLASAAAMTVGKGSTALYDAIEFSLKKVRSGRHQRRALIVISDGLDNSSRYSEKQIKRLLSEADVKVYAIDCPPLNNLAEASGGFNLTRQTLEESLRQVAIDLRHQYSLGYTPVEDGARPAWNRIKVKLLPPRGLPKLSIRARSGYATESLTKD